MLLIFQDSETGEEILRKHSVLIPPIGYTIAPFLKENPSQVTEVLRVVDVYLPICINDPEQVIGVGALVVVVKRINVPKQKPAFRVFKSD